MSGTQEFLTGFTRGSADNESVRHTVVPPGELDRMLSRPATLSARARATVLRVLNRRYPERRGADLQEKGLEM